MGDFREPTQYDLVSPDAYYLNKKEYPVVLPQQIILKTPSPPIVQWSLAESLFGVICRI